GALEPPRHIVYAGASGARSARYVMQELPLQSATATDPSGPMGDFLRRLRRMVLDEAESARRQIYQVWAKPVAARVAEGFAIEGVRVVRVEPNGVIELACDRNASRFREGDVLLLNRGNP